MVMTLDPRGKFWKFLSCPKSTFDTGKSCKISGGKVLYFERYQAKTHGGGGGVGKHPLSGFRVNMVYLGKVQEDKEECAKLCAEWSTK